MKTTKVIAERRDYGTDPTAPPNHRTNKVNPPTSINQGTQPPNPTNSQRTPNHQPDQQPRVRPTSSCGDAQEGGQCPGGTQGPGGLGPADRREPQRLPRQRAQESTRKVPGKPQAAPGSPGRPRDPQKPQGAPGAQTDQFAN